MAGPAIELRGVTKRFATPKGGIYTALRDLTLEVGPGEFCAVVGPTGCGKSTTLALISGLELASAGEVSVEGRPVKGIADGVGYVFQSDAVFPWKTVLENVAAGPRYHGVSGAEARARARDWNSRVGLAGFEDRYPHQLSGGMRKRVGLAQSLINGPRILLMDEPFSALDVQTRTLMENELLSLWSSTSASVVFVTHDLEEAIALADRVVLRHEPRRAHLVDDAPEVEVLQRARREVLPFGDAGQLLPTLDDHAIDAVQPELHAQPHAHGPTPDDDDLVSFSHSSPSCSATLHLPDLPGWHRSGTPMN